MSWKMYSFRMKSQIQLKWALSISVRLHSFTTVFVYLPCYAHTHSTHKYYLRMVRQMAKHRSSKRKLLLNGCLWYAAGSRARRHTSTFVILQYILAISQTKLLAENRSLFVVNRTWVKYTHGFAHKYPLSLSLSGILLWTEYGHTLQMKWWPGETANPAKTGFDHFIAGKLESICIATLLSAARVCKIILHWLAANRIEYEIEWE